MTTTVAVDLDRLRSAAASCASAADQLVVLGSRTPRGIAVYGFTSLDNAVAGFVARVDQRLTELQARTRSLAAGLSGSADDLTAADQTALDSIQGLRSALG